MLGMITGTCPNDSKELSDANLNFIKTHPLMNDAVQPFFGAPVVLRTGFNTGFTSLGVDAQVTSHSLVDTINTDFSLHWLTQ